MSRNFTARFCSTKNKQKKEKQGSHLLMIKNEVRYKGWEWCTHHTDYKYDTRKKIRKEWVFSTTQEYSLTIQSHSCALCVYPNELKTYVHKKICAWICTEVLFIIAKNWNKLRCLSTGKRINKLWYIHTVEYYSAIKRSELSSQRKT